ncbi:MAG: site-specific DNA-methyltransferase [Faecalibacterium prausnitzii]
MQTPNLTAQNIDKIAALFPNCITEMLDEEKSTTDHKVYKRGINFELLKQMLSPDVVDGDEAYEFTWVGKKASIVEANKPIRKTLRPCPEESKNWDDTENLYIEGDNLEVLKLLQESYLGKVKMIYIDPPYNTGNDFIYADDFMRSQDEENRQMGMYDEDENRLFKNNDSNGRFHSDWCSMMYFRLMLARNLLTDDGVIFMSIDDNERDNLEKLGAEIFGESNYVATFPWRKRTAKSDVPFGVSQDYEWIVCFAKTSKFIARTTGTERKYFETEDYPHQPWRIHDLTTQRTAAERPNSAFTMVNPKTGKEYPVNPLRTWAVTKETFAQYYAEGKIVFPDDYPFLNISKPAFRYWKSDDMKKAGEMFGLMPVSTKLPDNIGMSLDGTKEITDIFDGKVFSYPKTVELISFFIDIISKIDKEAIVLDFFSGSATTAHAVMQLNAKDGGHRKFVMVQLPEPCDEKSEAYKAGYKTICDIGKERIRRAGEKIKQEDDCWKCVPLNRMDGSKPGDDTTAKIVKTIDAGDGKPSIEMVDISKNPDVGFRVFKLDDTNMKDVYYSAEEYSQTNLEDLESNIKEDRTDLDLLFGCLLDWGLPLSMPYRSEKIGNCTVHTYAPGDAALNVPDALIACFDSNVPENVIKEIAKRKPRRAVFRDSSFASSPEKINVFEIFKLYAQDTDVKVI